MKMTTTIWMSKWMQTRPQPEGYNPRMEENRFTSEISLRIMQLRLEHRNLDAEIHTLQTNLAADQLLLQRLKKRKLWLKDTIVKLESQRIPDLDA